MNKHVKRIILGLVVLLAVGGFVYANSRPLQVEVIETQKQNVQYTFTEIGTVVGSEDYTVISTVSGKVSNVYVNKDDIVKKGTIIATINPEQYENEIQLHKNNIDGYRAKINDVAKQETNTKDTYASTIKELKTQLAQAEADNKLNDVNTIFSSSSLSEEQMRLLEIDLKNAQEQLQYQSDLLEKYKALHAQGVVSTSELQQYEQNKDTAQKDVDEILTKIQILQNEITNLKNKYGSNAQEQTIKDESTRELNEAKINQIKAQIDAAQKNLSKDYKSATIQYYDSLIAIEDLAITSATKNLNDCQIIATQDGQIIDLPIKTKPLVNTMDVICIIKTNATPEVESYVSTIDVTSLKADGEVLLVQKGREEDFTYKGKIKEIEDWAETRESTLGIVQPKVKITIEPLEVLKMAGSGYELDVIYTSYEAKDVIALPSTALYRFENKDYVFTVINDQVKTAPVKLGGSSSTENVILEGLAEQQIVLKNASDPQIKEGMQVSYTISN